MRGQFKLFPGTKREIIVPNVVVREGEESLIKMSLQGDDTIVAAAGNFYMGLCGQQLNTQGVVDRDSTLATIAGEPTTGGYARQPFTRDAVGWPQLSQVNGVWVATSRVVNFTAAAADIGTVWRAFICSVNAGNAGKLFSLSGLFPVGTYIANGQTFPVEYQMYFN